MNASASDSQLLPPNKQKPTSQKAPCEITDKTTRLLALAEELAHVGSWEWDVTQPRAVWSPEMFRIFGIEPRAEGLTVEEYTSFIHPNDLAEVSKRIQSSFGKVRQNQINKIDYRIIRPDGSIRAIHSQRLMKEVTPDGRLKVIVGVDQDVTEQKQAEEALKKSEQRFRIVAEAANVMVYEIEYHSGKVFFLSGTEKLFGYKPQEIEHTLGWAYNRIHPDDLPRVQAEMQAVVDDPKRDRYTLQYRIKHKDGRYITIKDTARAIRDPENKTLICIGGIRDITQRISDQEKIRQYSKHLEELVEQRTKQLQEKERLAAIGQTAGMVGHDIRNPLQALTGEVYLIKTEIADMPQNQAKQNINESLYSIEQGIGYINKIVADLQDYSRQLYPEMRSVDLADLIAEVFVAIAIPANIKLSFNVAPMPEVTLDPTFTRRALTNLINNAIQAMPDGGKLEIAAYQEENNIHICIADTGVGIPEEVKAKVFTPMFTTKAKGQGLGLAVVKRLVEVQGGSISFESKVGLGTRFLITLPL